MAIDPVCGMQVDENTAQWKSEHMGKTYYFCAPGCKSAFDSDPHKYMKKDEGEGKGEHQGHGGQH